MFIIPLSRSLFSSGIVYSQTVIKSCGTVCAKKDYVRWYTCKNWQRGKIMVGHIIQRTEGCPERLTQSVNHPLNP